MTGDNGSNHVVIERIFHLLEEASLQVTKPAAVGIEQAARFERVKQHLHGIRREMDAFQQVLVDQVEDCRHHDQNRCAVFPDEFLQIGPLQAIEDVNVEPKLERRKEAHRKRVSVIQRQNHQRNRRASD